MLISDSGCETTISLISPSRVLTHSNERTMWHNRLTIEHLSCSVMLLDCIKAADHRILKMDCRFMTVNGRCSVLSWLVVLYGLFLLSFEAGYELKSSDSFWLQNILWLLLILWPKTACYPNSLVWWRGQS